MDRKNLSDRGKAIETKAEEKEKKDYLRHVCDRLHLDPARGPLRGGTDQPESSSRQKTIEYIIAGAKEKFKNEADKEYLKREKEILDIFLRDRDQDKYSQLELLSLKIRSMDYLIAGKLSKTEKIRYSNHEGIREAFYPFYLDYRKQLLEIPKKRRSCLINKLQKKLQENR